MPRRAHGGNERIRPFLALTIYVALAVVLTLPLAAHFTTHVTGDGIDDPSLAWNLWWVKFSLVDRHLSDIFRCRWMFYPLGINLSFYTLTPLNGLEAIPLWVSVGHIVTVNLLLWFSFVMAAFGAYLLTLEVLPRGFGIRSRETAALLGGMFYAFAAPKMFYAALGQFNIASSLWIPFTVLYLERTRKSMRWSDLLMASMFLLFEAWSELSFASFLILWIGLWFVWELAASVGDRARLGKLVSMGIVMGAIFLIGVSPFLAHMLPDMKAYGDFWAPGGGFADVFSADLLGFLLPTMHNPIFGKIVGHFRFPHDKGQQLFIGYSLISLSLLGAWKGRRDSRVRFMAAAAVLFFLLTLGPEVRLNGRGTGIPGPFEILAHVPLLKGNRYPSRYSVLLFLALAELGAYGFSTLRVRKPEMLGAVLAVLFLVEHLSVPMPLSNLVVPSPYDVIARDRSDAAVLDLPLGWRNGFDVFGKSDVAIMYAQWYQSKHHHPIFGGNTSRNPEIEFRYFLETPLFEDLNALQRGKQVPRPRPDVSTIRRLACDLNLKYVVLHPGKLRKETISYVKQVLPLRLIESGDGTSVYIVDQKCMPRRGKAQIPAYMYAEGWHDGIFRQEGIGDVAWSWKNGATFLYPMSGGEDSISLDLDSPGDQTIELTMEGRPLGKEKVPGGESTHTWNIPPSLRKAGLARFTISTSKLWPLRYVVGTTKNGGIASPVPLLVRSAGKDFGDFAHVYVGGVDRSPNERGYNLVAVDSRDGRFLGAASFDTFLSESESKKLAAWIDRWPHGTLILGAVRDEASMHLEQNAIEALRRIGVSHPVKGHFRRAHAFIAKVGGGKALENWNDLGPAVVNVGGGWVRPWVRVGVEKVYVGFASTVSNQK